MKKKFVIALLLLAVGFFTSLQMTTSKKTALRPIPRELPLPAHMAEDSREALSKFLHAGIDAIKEVPLPENTNEWKAIISSLNEKNIETALKTSENLNTSITGDTLNGVDIFHVIPSEVAPEHENHLFLHIHGGAYVLNYGIAATTEASMIAHHLKIPVISIDYRMPPEHPAPAAVNDVMAVWSHLITERPASSIILGGTSAGGNITMASAMRIRDLNLPMPSALFVGTPGADHKFIGDSRYLNDGIDSSLGSWRGLIEAMCELYYKDDYDNPYNTPILGDFKGFPPVYLITGTRDLLLSDTVVVHRSMRRAGVRADLHVYEGHSHGDYLRLAGTTDSLDHFSELNAFALRYLDAEADRKVLSSPVVLDSLMLPENSLY